MIIHDLNSFCTCCCYPAMQFATPVLRSVLVVVMFDGFWQLVHTYCIGVYRDFTTVFKLIQKVEKHMAHPTHPFHNKFSTYEILSSWSLGCSKWNFWDTVFAQNWYIFFKPYVLIVFGCLRYIHIYILYIYIYICTCRKAVLGVGWSMQHGRTPRKRRCMAIWPWIWSENSSIFTRRRWRRNAKTGGPKCGARPSACGEFGTHRHPCAASQSILVRLHLKEGLVENGCGKTISMIPLIIWVSWWFWQPCYSSVVPISISESTASRFFFFEGQRTDHGWL